MLASSLKLSPPHFRQPWDSCGFFQRDTCVATTVEFHITSSDLNNATHPLVLGNGSW